jgi:rhodanese-related sulfurtransferase
MSSEVKGMTRYSKLALALAGCVVAHVVSVAAQHIPINPKGGATKAPIAPDQIERISVEELKSKIAGNEPVAVIDVRGSSSISDSSLKIRGAVHVKPRRLKSRLALAPLKEVPRDRMIVTYCACPNDESAIVAAQTLIQNGFTQVRVLKGGWNEWLKAGGQTDKRQKV